MEAWRKFNGGAWQTTVDVRDFIQKNYTLYEGDENFLVGPTERTQRVFARVQELLREEQARDGVLSIELPRITREPEKKIAKVIEIK